MYLHALGEYQDLRDSGLRGAALVATLRERMRMPGKEMKMFADSIRRTPGFEDLDEWSRHQLAIYLLEGGYSQLQTTRGQGQWTVD